MSDPHIYVHISLVESERTYLGIGSYIRVTYLCKHVSVFLLSDSLSHVSLVASVHGADHEVYVQ